MTCNNGCGRHGRGCGRRRSTRRRGGDPRPPSGRDLARSADRPACGRDLPPEPPRTSRQGHLRPRGVGALDLEYTIDEAELAEGSLPTASFPSVTNDTQLDTREVPRPTNSSRRSNAASSSSRPITAWPRCSSRTWPHRGLPLRLLLRAHWRSRSSSVRLQQAMRDHGLAACRCTPRTATASTSTASPVRPLRPHPASVFTRPGSEPINSPQTLPLHRQLPSASSPTRHALPLNFPTLRYSENMGCSCAERTG